ncbi:MAG: hypothetical protein DMD44_10175 [Gemmatimonadetes bacterium]|nr:MAG: hypothetical protein DMD44_10175 [Gemmatimonadota bacterium]
MLLSATAVVPLAGQRPLTVTGIQSLTFGTLIPGIPSVVSRTDAVKSGRFDVGGPHDTQGRLTFTLPSVLTGPAGATLPLTFSGSDAGFSQSQNIGSQIGFDPKQPFLMTFSGQGRGSVFLGATARPAPTQRAGSYTGTITLNLTAFP